MSSFMSSRRINFAAIVGVMWRPLTAGFPAAIDLLVCEKPIIVVLRSVAIVKIIVFICNYPDF